MATPAQKYFAGHWIVHVGSTYYDPSYGLTYTNPGTQLAPYVDYWGWRFTDHNQFRLRSSGDGLTLSMTDNTQFWRGGTKMKCGVLASMSVLVVMSTFFGGVHAMGSESYTELTYSATDLRIGKDAEGRSDVFAIPFDDDQDQVSVTLPDGSHKLVHVDLKHVMYTGTLTKHIDSKTTVSEAAWFCYELRSKDNGSPYSWYLWTESVLGRFKLFVTSDGSTYLTCVSFQTILIVEITKPMDAVEKTKKLDEFVNRRNREARFQYVSISQIIPQEPQTDAFVDKNTTGHYYSIYLTSLEKDGKGGFKLRLHGSDPSKIYTVITDKESKLGWRL